MRETILPHCSEKDEKVESKLINCTDNIVSYLLDTAKPLLLEASTQPEESSLAASCKLKQMIGD